MLIFVFSLIGFVFDEFTAQCITSIVHEDETRINSLIWYWDRYKSILDVMCGLACLFSVGFMVFIHVKGYYRFPARKILGKLAGR
ncbi:hypothetical protein FLA_3787 [Filimonas lacunae]|nr:hypothetical protein FLA_3787 [Filimonas lacunae]